MNGHCLGRFHRVIVRRFLGNSRLFGQGLCRLATLIGTIFHGTFIVRSRGIRRCLRLFDVLLLGGVATRETATTRRRRFVVIVGRQQLFRSRLFRRFTRTLRHDQCNDSRKGCV